jgi:hypothetical protein
MEDVLDLYAEAYDPLRPVVCLDEKPVVLHAEARPGQPAVPGRVECRDYAYVRHGTANLFVLVEPLAGWRQVMPTERRTQQDYAYQLRWLLEVAYPAAERVRLVQDNLSTHGPAALYATFPPTEARRLCRRLEFHQTPKHGSWLNMAEIEISIVARNCLARPVPDLPTLQQRTAALTAERNAERRTITWQFTTTDARTKLHGLYPAIQDNLD